MSLLTGCEFSQTNLPAPAGPGAASNADLSPWLVNATDDTRCGQLMYFNVASTQGCYYTWGLAPNDPANAVEVDIRPCLEQAKVLDGRSVIITGKLIDRGEAHLPLLVAQSIKADLTEDPASVAIADASNPFLHQYDPATDLSETHLAFQDKPDKADKIFLASGK